MYFNIDWKNDKAPLISAENLNWMQTQYEEMVEQIRKKKQDKTVPMVIRKDPNPNEVKQGEIFYLSGQDTQEQLSQTIGKTFYTFLTDSNGRMRYNNQGVEFRYKMVDKETASYLMEVGVEQQEEPDPAGHGTPEEISDNPYQPSKYTYTIYYYTNGGTTIENQTVAGGSVITEPAGETTKTGYDFDGWYYDTDFTQAVEFPFEVYGNINLYAKWEESQVVYYTISFDTNGGSLVSPVEVPAGTTIQSPTTTKSGYDFMGWYADSQFTQLVSFPYTVNANAILYAKWQETVVYRVITYVLAPGETTTVSVENGTVYSLIQPTRSGYNFVGWYEESTFETLVSSPITVTSDLTLYAKWEEIAVYLSDLSIRYIKWTISENNRKGWSNIFCELKAYDSNGTNVALNKPSWTSWDPTVVTNSFVNDGQTTNMPADASTGCVSCRDRSSTVYIDLQTPTELNSLEWWTYWGETYTSTNIVYISEDGTNWYKVFDGSVERPSQTVGESVTLTDKLKADYTPIDFSNNFKELGIRYVRMKSSSDTSGWGSLFVSEIEAFVNGTNVALGEKIRKYSAGVDSGWITSWATNGVYDLTNYNKCDASDHGYYLWCDLGAIYNVDTLKVWPYQNSGSSQGQIDFQIEVSRDGVNYYILYKSAFPVYAVKQSTAENPYIYKLSEYTPASCTLAS